MIKSQPTLINKVEDMSEVDTSPIKVIAIAVLGIAAAIASGYFLRLLLAEFSPVYLAASLGASLLFLFIFQLQILTIKSIQVSLPIIFGESLGIAAPFAFNFSMQLSIAWIILLLCLCSASISGTKELNNQIKIKFGIVAKKSVPRTITALCFFISILIASSLPLDTELVSPTILSKLAGPSDLVIQKILEAQNIKIDDFSLDMTINKLAESIVMSQLSKEQKSQVKMIPGGLTTVTNQVISGLNKQLEPYKFTLKPTSSIVENMAGFINQTYNNASNIKIGSPALSFVFQNIKTIVPLLVILLIYFTIKSTVYLFTGFYGLIYLLIYFFYQILLIFNFIHLSLSTREKEVIIL
ncbi:MAG: hypothetical protein PHN74_00480 [Candidatus Pacebacteria bacterium]|nr:hypothetical protein [Candidatus Paceibacterota bacterium]